MILEEKKAGEDEPGKQNPAQQQQPSHALQKNSHAHHTGVLKRMLERAVANRFSSVPIDMEKNRLAMQQQLEQKQQLAQMADEEAKICNSIRAVASNQEDPANNQNHYPTLTPSEQAYLETLLASEDPELIRQATVILSDHSLFPNEEHVSSTIDAGGEDNAATSGENDNATELTSLSRRDSKVQRLLFRMHEIGRGSSNAPVSSSTKANSVIEDNDGSHYVSSASRRIGWNQRKEGSTILEAQTSMSSLLAGGGRDNDGILAEEDGYPSVPVDRSGSSTTSQDILSWLDGTTSSKGVEVDNDEGVISSAKLTAESFFKTSFAILGTAADDETCFPHVLSPPLMESLMEFVPTSLSDYHFWIKYSSVRDGANLFTLLQHTRASDRTILAIETTDGEVFGAFTSRPWRLVPNLHADNEEDDNKNGSAVCNDEAFYGSNDAFLWKMRQSRFDSQALLRNATVEEAILMESEMAVYPFTQSNNFVQHCSVHDGIGLGDNASAIRLDPSLRTGSTAASDTFGNPCLLDPKKERVNFTVANLEVWTLTPHDKVKEAEQEELATFFQQCQHESNKRLNLFGILVGNK